MTTRSKRLLIGGIFLLLLIVGAFVPAFRLRLPAIIVPAEPLAAIGPFSLTNTIVAAWASIIVLCLLSWLATRNLQLVPSGLQNLVEAVIEAFMQPVEAVAGPENARRFFPLVFTIFAFVLTSNWMGLLPGYGTIGPIQAGHAHDEAVGVTDLGGAKLAVATFGSTGAETQGAAEEHAPEAGPGQVVGTFVPFLRGATTDINTTLAIALVAMVFVEFVGIRALGVFGYGTKFINVQGFARGGIFLGLIEFFVGLLEIIAELARIISFTFRLFGNIFAGEVLLAVVAFLLPWVATVPFLGLELFVGFIQAFVFAMLTVVFAATAMVSTHGGEHHGGAAAHH